MIDSLPPVFKSQNPPQVGDPKFIIPFRLTIDNEIRDHKSQLIMTVMDQELGKLVVDFMNDYYWKDNFIETAAMAIKQAEGKPIIADCLEY